MAASYYGRGEWQTQASQAALFCSAASVLTGAIFVKDAQDVRRTILCVGEERLQQGNFVVELETPGAGGFDAAWDWACENAEAERTVAAMSRIGV